MLAGNTAMLMFRLRKIQKSRKAFLKRLSEICLPRRKGTPFILTFWKSVTHFLKKLTETKEKGFLYYQKRFSLEKKVIKQKEKKCFSTHRFLFPQNKFSNTWLMLVMGKSLNYVLNYWNVELFYCTLFKDNSLSQFYFPGLFSLFLIHT